MVASPIFATLSQDLKEAMAAFVLWNKNEDADVDERTSLPKVHALLKEWENEKK